MKITVIIPAAGQSIRFSPSKNKLDEDLGGRPLLLRTVELFTKRDEIIDILVAAPPDNLDQFKFKYGDRLAFNGAKIVQGGRDERWQTVQNALTHISADSETTHVMVHDAARPATSPELIDRIIEAGHKLDAVIPTVPIHATIKRLGSDSVESADVDPIAAKLLGEAGKPTNPARPVIETIDRTNLVEVQTPQLFTLDLFKRAYAQPDLAEASATDDASLVERLGETVYAVKGDRFNLKVTTPDDFALIRKIMDVKPPKDRPTHKRF